MSKPSSHVQRHAFGSPGYQRQRPPTTFSQGRGPPGVTHDFGDGPPRVAVIPDSAIRAERYRATEQSERTEILACSGG